MQSNLRRQFADFFAHCISVSEFNSGARGTTVCLDWTDDVVTVIALSRYAREVRFRGELMGIIELEPTQ